jgi:regulator of protease activity HflC (stomatin/prohibitin superfamily)
VRFDLVRWQQRVSRATEEIAMKKILERMGGGAKRFWYLLRAAPLAVTLGIIEMVGSKRGRRALALLTVVGVGIGVVASDPIRTIEPHEVGIRVNRLTGDVSELREGWAVVLPALHRLRRYPLRDQVYRPTKSASAASSAPFQTVEGLSIGVEVTVRYALNGKTIKSVALALPDDVDKALIQPVIDGVLHRTFARHTVREIFSAKRQEIEKQVTEELAQLLAKEGVVVRDVFLGNVDLPEEYRRGLERLLNEELASEKMRYTLELKRKQVEQTALEAQAEKVRREKAAEAAGREQIIAAKARAEAMKHVLPLKEKEIEQRRLEAEASRVQRVRLAQANADARKIEAIGEAASRRKLAEAEAYRLEVTGKARTEQLSRDSALIAKNPLLIQKTLADKLSDKIQVIVAPPSQGSFFAADLIGMPSKRGQR